MNNIGRRGFLTLLGGAAAATALPLVALAQQPNEIFAVTATEGGVWIPRAEWLKMNYCGLDPHSVLYRDGRTWDEINGLRPERMWYSPEDMDRVRRIWPELRVKALLEYGYKV